MSHNPLNSDVTVGRIGYVNVAPVYYGLDNGLKPAWLKMVSAPPSVLNSMMAKGELDISPVSSVAYARHQDEWLLLPGLSVACFGRVMSAILVSRYPFDSLKNRRVILTDESATAAELLRFLFTLRGVTPHFEIGTVRSMEDFQEDAGAALVIGDAALKERWSVYYDYVWDLGNIWIELTGLPLVFAVWAARRSFARKRPEVVSSVIDLFRISKKEGDQNIKQIVASASVDLGLDIDVCRKYYDKLCFDLGPLQIDGLKTLFRSLHREKILPNHVHLSFFGSSRKTEMKKAQESNNLKILAHSSQPGTPRKITLNL